MNIALRYLASRDIHTYSYTNSYMILIRGNSIDIAFAPCAGFPMVESGGRVYRFQLDFFCVKQPLA